MHIWAIMILLMLVSSAGAKELPSEVDLRAAYCIPIVEYWISVSKPLAIGIVREGSRVQQLASEITAEQTEQLRRLQLYLLPRITHLESLSVITALKRGEEDRDKLEQYHTTCETKCEPPANKPASSLTERAERVLSKVECIRKCRDENPLKPRLDACSDLRWLPF
jgi:hypothetical protein